MPDGYTTRGLPDTNWWMEQVRAGIEYRKKYAKEGQWDKWRAYYRGNWRSGIMPVNMFFSMLRTVVPRVYFRDPSISVQPAQPGFEVATFAQILQRVDNRLMREKGMKRQLKRVVQDSFLFGTGVIKSGFGAQWQPTPSAGETGQPISIKGERFEYRDGIYQNMPWSSRLHTRKFIVPDGLEVYEDARWVAHWDQRPTDDLKRDPRFKNTKDLGTSYTSSKFGGLQGRIPMTDVLEIRDKKYNKCMVLAPMSHRDAQVMYFDDDEFLNRGAFPYFPVVFNEDDEVFWGIPDSVIMEPYQLEINEVRTLEMKHRRMCILKIMHEEGAITEEELEKMTSEDIAASVKVSDIDKVKPFQLGEVPQSLVMAGREIKEDFREAIGFSRNQFGEYKAGSSDTTATEAMIVKMASEIRVDERRDCIADVIVQSTEADHAVIFNHWGTEQVVDIIGPGGAVVWIKFKGSQLGHGQYLTNVDPDSSVPETKQVREQRSERVYGLLRTNPIIDPVKLTEYLLHEHHGVQFDDMMRALPPPDQMPNNPITADEFGGMVKNSLGKSAAQGGPPRMSGMANGDGRQPTSEKPAPDRRSVQ